MIRKHLFVFLLILFYTSAIYFRIVGYVVNIEFVGLWEELAVVYFINTVAESEESHTRIQPVEPFSGASLEIDPPLNKDANVTA